MNLALVEPFYTGSHQFWCDHLITKSEWKYQLFQLPGRHWKWRMHGAAIALADQINASSRNFDALLCSTLMDVALFKSLLKKPVPMVCYFHENQFAYPHSENDQDKLLKRDLHYPFINYTSALVADKVVFNSNFNRDTFMTGLKQYLSQLPDFKGVENIQKIATKTKVIPVGLEMEIKAVKPLPNCPVIAWNHRWEHDKNPEGFYQILKTLKENNFSFRLMVLGENYRRYPSIFDQIKSEFQTETLHWGYAKNRKEYLQLLQQADLSIVTSKHDFLGLSVLESLFTGLRVYAPNRLVYPEYIPEENLYESVNDLTQKISNNAYNSHYDLSAYLLDSTVNKMDELMASLLR